MNAMTFQETLALLDRQTAADAVVVLARIDRAGPGARGLFIDCGSNLGQGFRQFVKHYPLARFDYVMVEPNPNCLPALRGLVESTRRDGAGPPIEIIAQAAGTHAGSVRFFGLEQDPTSQGASMLKDHNSRYYAADERRALEVPCFSLAALIRERQPRHAAVVLKLDIEGGEYEVLPHVIEHGLHRVLDAAYIEFHSQYMAEPEATGYRRTEAAIRDRLTRDGVNYRIWI